MGDRHLSCMLSGLPIVENTPVRAFILVQPKNNYLQNSLFSMPHESTSLFLPIAPGIQGIWKENEAGNLAFAKAKPSECVSTGIVHFFGANADNPAKLVNMIIDTTREGKCRNVLFGSFRKEKVRTTLAFVREDAYAAFMKAAEIDPIDQDKVLKDLQAIKKARAESWRRNKKFVEHLSTEENMRIMADRYIYPERCSYLGPLFNESPYNTACSLAPYKTKLLQLMSKHEVDSTEVKTFATSLADYIRLNDLLDVTCLWRPSFLTSYSKYDMLKLNHSFNRAVADIAKKEYETGLGESITLRDEVVKKPPRANKKR